MRKIVLGLVAAAALATPLVLASSANASVAVDGTGTGFVGKGDVQTALGYANDAAFQPDARVATFSATSTTSQMAYGVKCGVAPNGVFDMNTIHAIDVNMGTVSSTVKKVNATPKVSGNKVTGYNLTGTGTDLSEPTPGTVDWSKWYASCPTGEAYAGWVDASNVFKQVTTTGDLTVSIGNKTAALPNTPAAVLVP